ncbi:DgyrCDS14666 [Dimorphilus gyrociliatus]|uniref:DgyrCDS14666 n=1 Tax=Dimorphilus gyrociliatus TaxID=2664684 RepID=A0A7I8WEG9_9ANNE|nr:DgyrCDS14666 [Dimorphilus gyrociliatus]
MRMRVGQVMKVIRFEDSPEAKRSQNNEKKEDNDSDSVDDANDSEENNEDDNEEEDWLDVKKAKQVLDHPQWQKIDEDEGKEIQVMTMKIPQIMMTMMIR